MKGHGKRTLQRAAGHIREASVSATEGGAASMGRVIRCRGARLEFFVLSQTGTFRDITSLREPGFASELMLGDIEWN